jgi:hypothetical protein
MNDQNSRFRAGKRKDVAVEEGKVRGQLRVCLT